MKNPWPRWPTQLSAIMDYDPFHLSLSLSLHLHFKCIISEPSKMHKKHVHTQGTVWNHTKPPKTIPNPCRKRAYSHVHTYNSISIHPGPKKLSIIQYNPIIFWILTVLLFLQIPLIHPNCTHHDLPMTAKRLQRTGLNGLRCCHKGIRTEAEDLGKICGKSAFFMDNSKWWQNSTLFDGKIALFDRQIIYACLIPFPNMSGQIPVSYGSMMENHPKTKYSWTSLERSVLSHPTFGYSIIWGQWFEL